MITRRWFIIVSFFVTSCVAAFAAKANKTSSKAYSGYIVTDAASGRVLLEDGADVQTPPASMTKLMTFAVLYDKLSSGSVTLQTPVRIAPEDAKMGGTQVYLDPRETFPVEELIYAMMIQSANDAAHALARTAGGSVPAFVNLMNAKARELGMTRTLFRSPHGLPPGSRRIADGDLTTPRDFAILCRYLLKNTDVLRYTSIRERDFGANRKGGPLHMRNHNNLLGKVAGVDGLKTGYTGGAGYCLSATAQRDGRRIIAVIMDALGPNGQIDKGRARDRKAIELIEEGFAAHPDEFKTATPTAGLTVASPSPAEIPTVKTTKEPAAGEQSSTPPPSIPTFRINPPSKKP